LLQLKLYPVAVAAGGALTAFHMEKELDIIQKTLELTGIQFIKLLPLESRTLSIEKLNSQNTMVQCSNENDFEDFRANWESFLNYLDKFWNQLNSYNRKNLSHKKNTLVSELLTQAHTLRTKECEEILFYLDKARNNTQHTLSIHLRESQKYEVLAEKTATIKQQDNKTQIHVSADGQQIVIFMHQKFILLNSIYEKRSHNTYNVPSLHVGKTISILDRTIPQMVGKIGYQYYFNLFFEFQNILNMKCC
jgi:hypothetical protein